uniref:NADH-quinone oxidoreductase subunit A n=1 Tax=Anathallis microphyta TaxID=2767037 RepID=A0A8F9WH69_9ASPA|nr:NADH-quinone oxidoreductase subunit A [Anathallis microphyta]
MFHEYDIFWAFLIISSVIPILGICYFWYFSPD